MTQIAINQLQATGAIGTSVVPVSTADGTATNKVTLAAIAALATGGGGSGATGATGPAGVTGATGPAGAVGATGPAGGDADARWAFFLPAAPTSVTASAGNAQVSVSWTAPTGVIAQAPVTDYTVQFSSNSGSTWTTFTRAASTATSTIVTGLSNATAYTFRVAAVNGIGTGTYSAATNSVTPTAAPLLTISRDNGTSTFTGSGTASSPYYRATGAEVATADGLGHYSWTAGATVTVTISFLYSDDASSGNTYLIKKNGTTVWSGGGDATNKTVSAVAGDVITITATGDLDAQYFSNVSVYAA